MKAILLPAFLLAGLAATGAMAQKAEVDCAMCHDSAPVPANHMPVDEVSVQSCGMCHQASGDDPYFRIVHQKHEPLGCETCHSDASAESAARLKEMLGQ